MKIRVLLCITMLVSVMFLLETGCGSFRTGEIPKPLFWAKDAGTPSERFETAKDSTPELIAFLRLMPKGADLHNHVSGATYSEYILDSAEKSGLSFDLETHQFFKPNDPAYKPVKPVTISELKKNAVYLTQFMDAFSMRGCYSGLLNGHDHFFNAFGLFNSGSRTSDDMIVEVVKRNIYQNVQYLELMVGSIPDEVENLFDKTAPDFDMEHLDRAYDQAVDAAANAGFDTGASIRTYLDAREQYLSKNGIKTGPGKEIMIRYIQQLKRSTCDMRKFFISAFYSMYAAGKDKRIAGVNLVQAEDTPCSRALFDDQMKIMDYLWKKMNKPSLALHGGELVLRESPVEPMKTRISDTIKVGHASRIGHGVSVAWENDVPGLLTYMKDNRILVEICLSSNEGILGVIGNDHPFTLYRKAGVKTALCTDDEGVNRSNLTMEYVKAVKRYNLSYNDVKDLSRNSLEYSFLPGESLYIKNDYTKIREEFKGMGNPNWKPTDQAQKLLKANPKLEREYRLERQLALFEEKLMNGR